MLTTRKQLKDVSVLKRAIHTSFVALSYRLQLSDTQKANIQLCPFHCCPKLKHNECACVRARAGFVCFLLNVIIP